MAGLYLHIPFCASRCLYCDFYSTTRAEWRDRYVDALCQEIGQRVAGSYTTLYLGGGTPSQLSPQQLDRLFTAIHRHASLTADAEVTMECNPDDITPDLLRQVRQLGVNRLSMGVQTFDDATLRFLRRRHTATQAVRAVHEAQDSGFENLSIDLIFGLPAASPQCLFASDLDQALSLGIQHLSAYSLMYEPGTALTRLRDRGEVQEVDEDISLSLFQMLTERTDEAGFEHYEISNFAQSGYRSRHNSSYWNDTPYTGLGAGAHSYDGHSRRWNHADLQLYIQKIEAHDYENICEQETLTHYQHYDEYVMTRLRTCEGIDLDELQQRFGQELHDYCLKLARPHIEARRLALTGGPHPRLHLTRQGIFTSNDVMSDLFYVDKTEV